MNGKRFRNLDFLRGISILLVLGSHCPAVIIDIPIFYLVSPFFESFGGYGVDIFFAISGYLIGGNLIKEKIQHNKIIFKEFYLRRYLKILPPFYVCLVANILLYKVFSKNYLSWGNLWIDMVPAFFNLQNYFSSTALFAWFWSLAVEEHFYFFLPIVLGFINLTEDNKLGRLLYLLLIISLICLVFRSVTWAFFPEPNGFIQKFPTHLRIDGLFAGVFVSTLRPSTLKLVFFPFLFLISVIGFWLAAFIFKNTGFEYCFTAISSGVLVLIVNKLDLLDAKSSGLNFISFIGQYTFSIYLWHGFLAAPIALRILEKIGYRFREPGIASFIHFALYFSVAIGMGILMSFLIENPVLKIRGLILGRSKLSE